MTSNNVVVFPKASRRDVEVPDLIEIEENLEMMKQYHIQETIATLAPMIFNQLGVAGFDLADDDDEDASLEGIKDGAFIVESLRSMMMKHYSIYHPFQDIADQIFSTDKEDIGVLKIADSLDIKFKKRDLKGEI